MGREQKLFEAARTGNVKFIEEILKKKKKYTRLGKEKTLVPFTYHQNWDVNCTDWNGETPLHLATLNSHKQAVELLLMCGASINAQDTQGCIPLHLAAWTGNSDVCQVLLTSGFQGINTQNKSGDTPLHIASQYGHTSAVRLLLENQANPMISNLRGESSLDLAAFYGRLETVSLLLNHQPALLHQVKLSHSPLHLAARNGQKEVLRKILQAGCNPNVKTNVGSALHEAAMYGKKEVAELLLHSGVDVSIRDSSGMTAKQLLQTHSSSCSREILKMIEAAESHGDYSSSQETSPSIPTPCGGRHTAQGSVSPISERSTSSGRHSLYDSSENLYDLVPCNKPLVVPVNKQASVDDTFSLSPESEKLATVKNMCSSGSPESVYDVPISPSPELKKFELPRQKAHHIYVNLSLHRSTPDVSKIINSVAPKKPPRERNESLTASVDGKLAALDSCKPPISPGDYVQLAIAPDGPTTSLKPSPRARNYSGDQALSSRFSPAPQRSISIPANCIVRANTNFDSDVQFSKDIGTTSETCSVSGAISSSSNNASNVYENMEVIQQQIKRQMPKITPRRSLQTAKLCDDIEIGCTVLQELANHASSHASQDINAVERPDTRADICTERLADVTKDAKSAMPSETMLRAESISQAAASTGMTLGSLPGGPSLLAEYYRTTSVKPFSYVSAARPLSGLLYITERVPAMDGSKSDAEDNDYEEWKQIDGIFASMGADAHSEGELSTEKFLEYLIQDRKKEFTISNFLHSLFLDQYEIVLIANGYDNINFLNGGILDEADLRLMGFTSNNHVDKLMENVERLPRLEPVRYENPDQVSVNDWLKTLDLDQYSDNFISKNYVNMKRVQQIWEVELASVLGIQLLGHQKRILASLGENRPGFNTLNRDLKLKVTDISHIVKVQDIRIDDIDSVFFDHNFTGLKSKASLKHPSFITNIPHSQNSPQVSRSDSGCSTGSYGTKPELPSRNYMYAPASEISDASPPGLPPKKHSLTSIPYLYPSPPVRSVSINHTQTLPHKFSPSKRCDQPLSTTTMTEISRSHSAKNIMDVAEKHNGFLTMDGRRSNTQQKDLSPKFTSSDSFCESADYANISQLGKPLVANIEGLKLSQAQSKTRRAMGRVQRALPALPIAQQITFAVDDLPKDFRGKHKPEMLINGYVNYSSCYLGTCLVRDIEGPTSTREAIAKMKKATETVTKLPVVVLSISFRGVNFVDSQTKNAVCNHEITNIYCAAQDSESMNYFAYITKDSLTKGLYCHVFCVKTEELAREVIMTLGEAFEIAYYASQKDRSLLEPDT